MSNIFNLNTSTGVVGSDTGLNCSIITNNFSVHNTAGDNTTIVDVSLATGGITLTTGSFPVFDGDSAVGYTMGMSGTQVYADIDNTAGSANHTVNLIVNGVTVDSHTVLIGVDYPHLIFTYSSGLSDSDTVEISI